MMEAVGEQRGAPSVEAWLTIESDPELVMTALEHVVRRPSPSRTAAAGRLAREHKAPEVRSMAAAVVAHWEVGGPGIAGG